MTQTSSADAPDDAHKPVTVKVNNEPVTLPKHRVNGLQIKEAAIAAGLDIKLDFELTEEGRDGKKDRNITDDEEITVTKHSEFICNEGEEDS